MPKQKSHKGLLKRIKITGTGKVKHKRRGTSHLNSGATGVQHMHRHRDVVLDKTMAKKLERVLNMRLKGRDQD